MGLTFANYVLQPFFNDCIVPVEAAQLLAAATICKLVFEIIACSISLEMKNLNEKKQQIFYSLINYRFSHIHQRI